MRHYARAKPLSAGPEWPEPLYMHVIYCHMSYIRVITDSHHWRLGRSFGAQSINLLKP